MKEYNWRKEREKYQPDFNKRPEYARQENTHLSPVSTFPKWIIALLVIIVLIAIGCVLIFGRKSRTDSAAALSNAAEKYKSAVGLVICNLTAKDGRTFAISIGTAWAFENNKFATNAHVAYSIKESLTGVKKILAKTKFEEEFKNNGCNSPEEYLKKVGAKKADETTKDILAAVEDMVQSVGACILINGDPKKRYEITSVQIHRKYVISDNCLKPDLAVLTVSKKHDCTFRIADTGKLRTLKSGTPIAFLGFPMENLIKDNVNLDNPVASMQSGIVVAVSNFDLKDTGEGSNYLIRHNLPSTGGSSGSPLFDADGEVVGVLFAVNMVNQITSNGTEANLQRAPSGAQINYAVRADLLDDMGAAVSIDNFLK